MDPEKKFATYAYLWRRQCACLVAGLGPFGKWHVQKVLPLFKYEIYKHRTIAYNNRAHVLYLSQQLLPLTTIIHDHNQDYQHVQRSRCSLDIPACSQYYHPGGGGYQNAEQQQSSRCPKPRPSPSHHFARGLCPNPPLHPSRKPTRRQAGCRYDIRHRTPPKNPAEDSIPP